MYNKNIMLSQHSSMKCISPKYVAFISLTLASCIILIFLASHQFQNKPNLETTVKMAEITLYSIESSDSQLNSPSTSTLPSTNINISVLRPSTLLITTSPILLGSTEQIAKEQQAGNDQRSSQTVNHMWTRDVVLVIRIADWHVLQRINWYKSLYSVFFRKITFYADRFACIDNDHYACVGPSPLNNPALLDVLDAMRKSGHKVVLKDDETSISIDDDTVVHLRFSGGGWQMHRNLMHAVESDLAHIESKKNEGNIVGWLLQNDDAVVLPWRFIEQGLDPNHFWLSPLGVDHRIGCASAIGSQNGGTWTASWAPVNVSPSCRGDGGEAGYFLLNKTMGRVSPESNDMPLPPLSSFVDVNLNPSHSYDANIFKALLHEQEPDLAKRWETNMRRNFGHCQHSELTFCVALQNDFAYVPRKHAKDWLRLISVMISAKLEFHLVFSTLPLGLMPGREIDLFLSVYTHDPNVCRELKDNSVVAYHPCKYGLDAMLAQAHEKAFRKHNQPSRALQRD
jgi:hypothetical protein